MVELPIAVAIVGLGLASMVTLSGACTRAMDGSRQLTQAVFLAESIREWSILLPMTDPDPEDAGNPPGPDPYDAQDAPDDLDDLMGITFSPPRDGTGNQIYDAQDWSQVVTLTWVDAEALTPVEPGSSNAVEVQVEVSLHGRPIFATGWLLIGRQGQ